MVRKGFKNTEIGEIPEDWEVKELGEVLKFGSGRDYKHLKSGEIPVYGTGGLMTSVDEFLFNGESVGIGRKGTIDKPVYLNGKFWTVDTLFYTHSFTNTIPKFIYYQFLQIPWREYNEASGVPSLNKNNLERIKIPLPPLPEQKAIAEALSDTDAWIENLEQLIAKKRLIKQGAMQQLLTPKEDWQVKKLGDCLSYIQPTKYLVKSTAYHQNNEIPVLTAGKTFILGYTNEVDGIFDSLPTIIFDDFTTASKFVNFPFKAKSSAMKMLITKSENYSLRFLYETLQALDFPKGDHKRHWIGEFQKLEIRIPSLSEQTRIATILSDMDTELESLENTLGKARQIKQGMMQELLTGRVRLV
jgi:type I restriction enzyme S subunit